MIGQAEGGGRVVGAAALLSLLLGSVHAFSVFLGPLGAAFGASRSGASATYSLALVALTAVVLLGPRVFSAARPAALLALAAGLAAAGAALAAFAGALWQVWLGYGLIFGAANGLGYGYGLQLAAQAWPRRSGAAMGVVTAAYALGAAVAPGLFEAGLAAGGFQMALGGLALILLLSAPLVAVMAKGASYTAAVPSAEGPKTRILPLWLTYGAGVAAGLMAIGHAAGIAAEAGLGPRAWLAPMVIAAGNLAASLGGGWLADRWPAGRLLAAPPLCSAAALATLAAGGPVLPCLALIGVAYGATIAITPAVIARQAGFAASARVYGRVFTAWGAAGLIAPMAAGMAYDLAGAYAPALVAAAALSLISAALAPRAARQSTLNQKQSVSNRRL